MELIKKSYQKIIAYGLIVMSILLVIATFIFRPQQPSTNEIYDYHTTPELIEISFPYSLNIPLSSRTDYIELHFGDDSINNYTYTIAASKNSELIFSHDYKDEISNIVRIPLGETEFADDDRVDIQISCNEKCENVKFKLYRTDEGLLPKIAVATHKLNLYYLWFAWLLFIISLILLPLTKGDQK